MSKVIQVNGTPLLLFILPHGVVIESYELARHLGYTQPSSVRKQILTDWKRHFDAHNDKDFALVQNHRYLDKYDAAYSKGIGPIKPVKENRGRLFLTPSGVAKVLGRTSKDSLELQDALELEGFLKAPSSTPAPAPTTRVPATAQPLVDLKQSVAEDRKYQYDVLQTLLSQLTDLQDVDLKLLAIEAAEIALGRSQPDLRAKYEDPYVPSRSPVPAPAPAPSSTVTGGVVHGPGISASSHPSMVPGSFGPVFQDEGFYGLKQIGERAGGYSSVTAGKAANIVAKAMGYSGDDIRTRKLEFNELPVLPDSTSGKPRRMYRFNRQFSNQVILTLRTNKEFVQIAGPLPLTSFSSGAASHPKLTQGPFEEEDSVAN